MTELDLLNEEIKEFEEQIFRMKNSLNRQDNGVKLKRMAVINRTLERLRRARSRQEQAA